MTTFSEHLVSGVVFDYDDTILPTSWLKGLGYDSENTSVTQDVRTALTKMEEAAMTMLKEAYFHSNGRISIISNAEHRWFVTTCNKFLPRVFTLVTTLGIPVISALDCYGKVFPDNPYNWKICAFRDFVGVLCGPSHYIVSIGDSEYERIALMHVANIVSSGYKSLKMCDAPSCELLQCQQALVSELMKQLLMLEDNVDFKVTLTTNNTPQLEDDQNIVVVEEEEFIATPLNTSTSDQTEVDVVC